MAQTPEYTPTREQIQAACLELQRGWTPEEEARRRGGRRIPDAIKSVRLGLTYRFAEVSEPRE